MPDPTLHGNHDPCPACEGRGRVATGRMTIAPIDCGKRAVPVLDVNICRECRGMGRIARPIEAIIADMRSGHEEQAQ